MALGLGTLAVVFETAGRVDGQPQLDGAQGPIAVVALNVFVAFFAASWGPVVWVLLGEMSPNSVRAAALSVGVMANWIANFVVSERFPELVQVGLGIACGLFAVSAVLSLLYVWRFVRETKGTELEQMDALESGPPRLPAS